MSITTSRESSASNSDDLVMAHLSCLGFGKCSKNKTPSNLIARSSILLHEHPNRIFYEPRQCLHELSSLSAIADSMVNRDRRLHAPARLDLSVFHNGYFSC